MPSRIVRRRLLRPRVTLLEDRTTPAIFTVTTLADAGAGSLRDAIAQANATAGLDIIDFKIGLAGTITLTTGEIAINEALTVSGPGAGVITISGNNASRVFNTSAAAAGAAISFSGLTMTAGKTAGFGGAALFSDEAIALTNCVITGNTAQGGGGVAMLSTGTIKATACAFTNNTASAYGGGIDLLAGKLSLTRCTVSGNKASTAGGVYTRTYLLLLDTTVSGNTASTAGGGIRVDGGFAAGALTIRNSTISGNSATTDGGGMALVSFTGNLVVQNSTITANTAAANGGGIAVVSGGGSSSIESTVLQANTAPAGTDAKTANTLSAKNSAIGSITGITTFTNLGGNLFADPNIKLGPLADNGGPTLTHLPQPGSTLVNAGTNPAGLATDQRGLARVFNAVADIGAVEINPATFVVDLATDEDDGNTGKGDLSLREAIGLANAFVNTADSIIFDPAVFSAATTITLTLGEISIADAVTITGTAAGLAVSGNNASRIFNTAAGVAGMPVILQSLTLTAGKAASGFGGAVSGFDEALTLIGCTLTGNTATTAGGGAVGINGGGSLTAINSKFVGNTTPYFGGAIDVFGSASAKTVLTACTIAGNSASTAGGLYARGFLLVDGCTISGNTATGVTVSGHGGGIRVEQSFAAGALTIRNSTISGNTAAADGGGVDLRNVTGTLVVQNSTIAFNTAGGKGGGISANTATPVIALESSIVAKNTNTGATAPDISSSGTVNQKTSVVFSGVGFVQTNLGGNLAFGTDPQLAGLADNGGPTFTHAITEFSPVVNKGSNPAVLAQDQRGLGFPRVTNGAADMGAFETTQIFLVTNTNDAGAGSLRQAILDANALTPSADIIRFDSSFTVARTITLTTGVLNISDAVDIQGKGARLTTVSGNNASRIFSTSSAPAKTPVSITGLTLTAAKGTGDGGAVVVSDENLSLTGCVLTGNSASSDGAGVAVIAGGGLTLQACTLSGNAAADDGGAVYFFYAGSLTIVDSTLSGNSCADDGGAIYFFGAASGPIVIRNSTISGNTAGNDGGGVVLVAFAGTLSVQNSTLTANSATVGGAVALQSGSGAIALESSIVSGNSASSVGPDVSSTAGVALKSSAVGTASGFTATDLGGNLAFGTDLKLGPLQINGGPTATHALLAGSPAVDAGTNPAGLSADQRGTVYGRVVNVADIGAYETAPVFLVTNTNDAGPGSLRAAIVAANASVGVANLIRFDAAAFAGAQTITLTTGELAVADTLEVQGTGAKLFSLSGNAGSRIFSISGGGVIDVVLSGLTLTKAFSAFDGGAIRVLDETLIIRECVLTANTSTEDGAGITFDSFGNLLMQRCTVSGNVAADDGGGIYFFSGGSFVIEDSTVSGNTAGGDDGGGMYFFGSLTGPGVIRNSTFSGNTSKNHGGGLALISFGDNAPVVIQNSTFTLNTATGTGGGGIGRRSGTGTIVLQSTIVAQNTNAVAADIFFNVATNVTATNNVIGSANTGNFTLLVGPNQTGTQASPLNALLTGLGSFGGPTPTHLPRGGSPAVDKGANPAGLAFDQRGQTRVFNSTTDVGAAEVNPATFVVDVAVDEFDGNVLPGDLSLREAIDLANASPASADIVQFDPVVFATAKTITLTLGEIAIAGPTSVTGPAAKVTVSGNSASRVFNTSPAPAGAAILFQAMTITAGKSGSLGGGVRAEDEAVSFTNCAITNNASAGGAGGVGMSNDGSLTFVDCTLTGNKSDAFGGAIDVYNGSNAKTVIRRCTISGNTAQTGGGLYSTFYLLLDSSTVSGNTTTTGGGGGIRLGGTFAAGALTIRNSTISGNTSGTDGGGIAVNTLAATLVVQNSTITANTAAGKGGGISTSTATPVISLASSIVAKNTNAAAPEIFTTGTVEFANSSLFSLTGITTISDKGGNRPFGEDPQLGPLANNGGPTPTHLPASSSPVLNQGSNPAGLLFDQRGAFRQVGAGVDMGAVERQAALAFVVDITADENDGNFGPGDLSLREAVALASASVETADSISFSPAVFGTPQTITLTLGEIAIGGPVSIQGPGAGLLTVSGNNASRIFNTSAAPAGTAIAINQMTLTGGFSTVQGGAVFGAGQKIAMSGMVLTANKAAFGGAVLIISGGSFTADDCVFTGNIATSNIGAIGLGGAAKTIIRRSTISGNSAALAVGGLYTTGYLFVEDSTISGNAAVAGVGGGIAVVNAFAAGALTIRNSTISGNTTGTNGGAVYLLNVTGTLVVQNSTIAFNSAGGKGGGIAANNAGPVIALESSVVSKNSNIGGTSPDIFTLGSVEFKTSSIFSLNGITTISDKGGNRPFNEDPQLLPLASNGGPTQTHGLALTSPVRNQGSNPAALANDQRGSGFVRVFGAAADMGAFELQAPPTVSAVLVNQGANQRSRVTTVTVTFSQAVTLPGNPADAFTLVRQGGGSVTLAAAVDNSGPTTVVTLTFTGGAVNFGSLADGRYTLTVLASQVGNVNGALDGDGNLAGGDDFVLVGDPATAPRLFRLFGDNDGDGDVDAQDFGAFRGAFGGVSNLAFDFDNDGDVDAADFGQFRARFGSSV